MGPMAPVPGMTGFYANLKCSFNVEVVEYEELSGIYRFKLRVLKSLNTDSGCPHEEGDEFIYDMPKDAEPNKLETLILE